MIGKKIIYMLLLYNVILNYYHCGAMRDPRNFRTSNGCVEKFNSINCVVEASCFSSVANFYDDNQFDFIPECSSRMFCPQTGREYYPLVVKFKDFDKNEDFANIMNIRKIVCSAIILDFTFNNFEFVPNIFELKKLQVLNVSHNEIVTANLFNYNYELVSLKEIDFTYNKILDIYVDQNENVYTNLKKLWLSHNNLVDIPENVFRSFSELEYINLSYNQVANVNESTFEGLNNMQILHFSYNEIVDLNNCLFRFTKLKELYLNNNKIVNISARDLGRLSALQILDLSNNAIEALEKNVLEHVSHLKKIDLSFNHISIIDKNMFSSIINLHFVDLSKNEITELPTNLFRNKSLSHFSLKENNVQGSLERGMFEGLGLNTKLDLSFQRIKSIEDYAFFGLDNLLELYLNNNLIQSLSKNSFKTLHKILRLDLSYNKITKIDFDKQDLLSLQSLILQSNHIGEIKKNSLIDLQKLQFLDLSHNNLTKIETESFKSQVNVDNLLISKNPLSGSLESKLFEGLNLVPLLDLSCTKLNVVQNDSFDSMFLLYNLNISHSKISEVQYNSFSNTGNINIIDLSHNEIEVFSVNTTQLSNLKQLILNNNRINVLYDNFLKGILMLNKIVLSHNSIKYINNEHFRDQQYLHYVDLSYNRKILINFLFIKNTKELDTLILSGSLTNATFKNMSDVFLTRLEFSNSNLKNVNELNLSGLKKLKFLKLSNNNITKLLVKAFANLSNLEEVDVSYNSINEIQPGVFYDNLALKMLNISHNSLLELSYGALHGLLSLTTLDISYNFISSLESERFYEVVSLNELIVDHNKITDVTVEDFRGLYLKKLSIGDNPLPCHTIVNLKKNEVMITAARKVNSQEENVYGITCNKKSQQRYLNASVKDNSGTGFVNSNTLLDIRDILLSLKSEKRFIEDNLNTEKNMFNLTELLEKSHLDDMNKFQEWNNATLKLNDEQKTTNNLLERLLKVIVASNQLNRKTNESLQPIQSNLTSENYIQIINKVKEDFENAMILDKEKILSEIDDKLLLINKRIETLFTTTPISILKNDKLTLGKETKQSIFVETCVGLILFISVLLLLLKVYKSRRYILRRRSVTLSTRQIADEMDSSNV